MKRRFVRLAAIAVAASTTLAVVGPSAWAEPVDSKRAEAAQLQQQIEANGMKIAALGERYNGAQLAVTNAEQQVALAQDRLAKTRARKQSVEAQLRARAAALYRNAGSSTPLTSLNIQDLNAASRRSRYATIVSERDVNLVAKLKDLRDQYDSDRATAERRLATARSERDAAQQAKKAIETANAREQQLLSKVKGEIATLVAQEQQRRDEAARRAALARVSSAPARTPARKGVDPETVGGNFPQVPVSGRVAAVIAYARAQIGKPYVFATAGPDTFDCSGLTMMAWRQAGVSMAHFSGAQFNAFPHVALSDLQPGDLVFKGPGGVDHVALYIGGGMQIAATHTGSFVKLQPLGSPLSGAVRPG